VEEFGVISLIVTTSLLQLRNGRAHQCNTAGGMAKEVEFCKIVPTGCVDLARVEPSKEQCQDSSSGLEHIRMGGKAESRLELRTIVCQQRSRHHKRLWHALIGSDLHLLLITANEAPFMKESVNAPSVMDQ
jgi:hypothetical protein